MNLIKIHEMKRNEKVKLYYINYRQNQYITNYTQRDRYVLRRKTKCKELRIKTIHRNH